MASTEFYVIKRGYSPQEAYKAAVEEAIDEDGDNAYNGTISTTYEYEDKTKQFKESKLTLQQFIDKRLDSIGKRSCEFICLEEPVENTLKKKVRVTKRPAQKTKQWSTVYAVKDFEGEVYSIHGTQTEAVKAASVMAEKEKQTFYVHVEKKLVNDLTEVAEVSYIRSKKENSGRYAFYGLAQS